MLQKPDNSFVVQYATLKLIEQSDEVTAEDVITTTGKVRDIVNGTGEGDAKLSLQSLNDSFRDKVDISSLAPSDQLLVNALITRVESTIASRVSDTSGFITSQQTTTILRLLDDIDEAASLSG